MNRVISILLVAIIFPACTDSRKSDGNARTNGFKNSLVERRIDSSSYYISLPKNYALTERDGVDFSVYYFALSDTSKKGYNGGFYFGNYPSKFGPHSASCKSESIQGKILDNYADWTIYTCKNNYSIQTIIDSRSGHNWNKRIHAFGNCSSKKELNEILDIFSTFKKNRDD